MDYPQATVTVNSVECPPVALTVDPLCTAPMQFMSVKWLRPPEAYFRWVLAVKGWDPYVSTAVFWDGAYE